MREFTIDGFDIASHNQTVRLCVTLLRVMQTMSGRDLSGERLSIMTLLHEGEGGGFVASDKIAAAVSLYQDSLERGRPP